jgi:hypothetical protein
MFHQTIKTIEDDLREQDPAVTLNSFIISVTPYHDISWAHQTITKAELEQRNVLFQKDDKEDYIRMLLEKAYM